MQYIELQPQLTSSVPLSTVGSVNFFIDSTDKLPKTKDSDGNITNLSFITVTKDEADILISNNNLFINQIYKITGVMKNKAGFPTPTLYDDGNNSGVNIYLTAISNNKFETNGYGEFYNPKYLSYDTYDNRDKTGLYGIWDGENPSSIATYSIGDVAFWGGYAWSNLSGNVGTSGDASTLSGSDWAKFQFSDIRYYTKAIDYIEYDYLSDWLVRRKDIQNNIDVITPFETYWNAIDNKHPIAVTQWGNNTPYSAVTGNSYSIGLSNVFINDSYFETVNFKGKFIYNLTTTYTYGYQFYFGYRTIIENVIFNTSWFSDITLYYDWVNESDSYFGENEMKNSYLWSISLSGSNFSENIINGSGIGYLFLTTNSQIETNQIFNGSIIGCTMDASSINNNYINTNSSIVGNILGNSQITYNQLFDSYIENNNMTASTIDYNILTNGSAIQNNQNGILNSTISRNTLTNDSNIQNILVGGINNITIGNNNLSDGSIIDSILGTDSTINYNSIKNVGAIQYVQLDTSSHLDGNVIDGGAINGFYYQNIMLSNSQLTNNTLSDISNIRGVGLTGATIQYNNLTNESYIGYLTMVNGSSVNYNSVSQNSGIEGVVMDNSSIYNNIFNSGTYFGDGSILSGNTNIHNTIYNNTYTYINFESSEITNSIFNNTAFEPSQSSGPITGKSLQKVEFKDVQINQDIDSASVIFSTGFSKNVFSREDGTVRLSYYDNSDTIVITDITL